MRDESERQRETLAALEMAREIVEQNSSTKLGQIARILQLKLSVPRSTAITCARQALAERA